jgi:ATP-dependent DNA helicase RecQ
VEKVYELLCNHYQVAANSGEMREVDFDLPAFSTKTGMSPGLVFNALRILEIQEMFILSEGFHQPSRVHLMVDNTTLYDFELRNPKVAAFLKLMLRSYGGLFENYVRIDEGYLARNLGVHAAEVSALLEKLKEARLLDYVPARSGPSLTFLKPRERKLHYDQKAVLLRKKAAATRLDAVFGYAQRTDECRSRMLLHYFGEKKAPRCGTCDHCLEDKKNIPDENEYRQRVKEQLAGGKLELKTMVAEMGQWHEEGLQQVLQHMLDEGVIVLNDRQELEWKGRA